MTLTELGIEPMINKLAQYLSCPKSAFSLASLKEIVTFSMWIVKAWNTSKK